MPVVAQVRGLGGGGRQAGGHGASKRESGQGAGGRAAGLGGLGLYREQRGGVWGQKMWALEESQSL